MTDRGGLVGRGLMGTMLLGGRDLANTSSTVTVTTGRLYAVSPSTSYVAFYELTAGANGASRTDTPIINWYESDGVTLISSSSGTPVAIAPRAVGNPSVIATSPSNAAFCTVEGSIASMVSFETFAMSEAELIAGTAVIPWSLGGFVGNATAEFQISLDDGATWNDMPNGASVPIVAEQAQILDYLSPFNVPAQYRARTVLRLGDQVYASDWAPIVAVTVTSKNWWIVDALYAVGEAIRADDGPTAQMLWRVLAQSSSTASSGSATASSTATTPGSTTASLVVDRPEQQGIFRAFGRENAIVVHGDVWAEEFDLGMYFATEADFDNFDLMRQRQITLLLKSDMEGKTYWISLGSSRPATILRASDRQSNPKYGLSMHCTPVDAAI